MRCNFNLPDDLVVELDKAATTMHLNRTSFVCMALTTYLQQNKMIDVLPQVLEYIQQQKLADVETTVQLPEEV